MMSDDELKAARKDASGSGGRTADLSTPASRMLPERHQKLLELLLTRFESDAEPDVGLTRSDFVQFVLAHPAISYWSSFVEEDGRVQSPELEEDLDYLHMRGYLFASGNSNLTPTKRTYLLLRPHAT